MHLCERSIGKNRQAAADLLDLAGREDLNIEVVDLDVTVPASVSSRDCAPDVDEYRH